MRPPAGVFVEKGLQKSIKGWFSSTCSLRSEQARSDSRDGGEIPLNENKDSEHKHGINCHFFFFPSCFYSANLADLCE